MTRRARVAGKATSYDAAGRDVMILEGVFAAHASVRSLIDLAVFVEAPQPVQRARFDALYRWKQFTPADTDALWQAPQRRGMARRRCPARLRRFDPVSDREHAMIVSCAPFRVGFAGGGSDIAQFYKRRRGAVLSCAIAKYAFVVVHPFFNASKYHLKYTRTELVDRLDEIQHPILREALRMQNIEPGIEVVSVADIPSGTGLGSSSSFSVALLNALYAHRRSFAPKETLANEACILEIEKLGEPIGKRDQYAAAYGGVNFIEFEPHGGVTVQPLPLASSTVAALESHMMLFFTGGQRDARAVLSHQVKNMESDEAAFGRIGQMSRSRL